MSRLAYVAIHVAKPTETSPERVSFAKVNVDNGVIEAYEISYNPPKNADLDDLVIQRVAWARLVNDYIRVILNENFYTVVLVDSELASVHAFLKYTGFVAHMDRPGAGKCAMYVDPTKKVFFGAVEGTRLVYDMTKNSPAVDILVRYLLETKAFTH